MIERFRIWLLKRHLRRAILLVREMDSDCDWTSTYTFLSGRRYEIAIRRTS